MPAESDRVTPTAVAHVKPAARPTIAILSSASDK